MTSFAEVKNVEETNDLLASRHDDRDLTGKIDHDDDDALHLTVQNRTQLCSLASQTAQQTANHRSQPF
jgi:uncharacterized protein YajQ (UPF0234 family)